jgi:hypothetical protein
MRFQQVISSLAALTSLATAVDLTGYEYVVVGSGAGGGYVKHIDLLVLCLIISQSPCRSSCPRWSQDSAHRSWRRPGRQRQLHCSCLQRQSLRGSQSGMELFCQALR